MEAHLGKRFDLTDQELWNFVLAHPIGGAEGIVSAVTGSPSSMSLSTDKAQSTSTVSPEQSMLQKVLMAIIGSAGSTIGLGPQTNMAGAGPATAPKDAAGAVTGSPVGAALQKAFAITPEEQQAGQPLDTSYITGPIERSYEHTILPGINAAAIRAGAPGGSTEQDLYTQAAGDFGRGMSEGLGSLELQRRTQAANLGATERDVAVKKAMSPLQLILSLLSPSAGIQFGGGTTQKFETPSFTTDLLSILHAM